MTNALYASSSESESSQGSAFNPPPQALIRRELLRAGVLAVRLIGPPGSGKTELIESTSRHLPSPHRLGVIVINPAAQRDAARLRPHCKHIEHIDAAVPRAAAVWRAVQQMPLDDLDVILIEACGGLAVLDDLGQDATVAAFAISGGDDKAAEYHALLKNSSLVLLTHSDMRSLVKFDDQSFRDDVRAANSSAEIFEVSSVTGSGLYRWLEWLNRTRAAKRRRNAPAESDKPMGEEYVG